MSLSYLGLSQSRVRNCTPPPQVREHCPNSLHEPQFPSCFMMSGVSQMQWPLKQCCSGPRTEDSCGFMWPSKDFFSDIMYVEVQQCIITLPFPHMVPSMGGPFLVLQKKGLSGWLHHSCLHGSNVRYCGAERDTPSYNLKPSHTVDTLSNRLTSSNTNQPS